MTGPTPQVHRFELVARISKTIGLDGQLVAHEVGELSVLRPELEVWVVPPALEGVRHTTIAGVRLDKHKSGVLLNLEGVDDRTEAGKLVERYLLAKTEDLALNKSERTNLYSDEHSSFDEPYEEELEAFALVPGTHFVDTNSGPLGILESTKSGPAYDIWVVQGSLGTLEIPAVDAYVESISQKEVRLSLPAGFIEITSQDGKGNAKAVKGSKEQAQPGLGGAVSVPGSEHKEKTE